MKKIHFFFKKNKELSNDERKEIIRLKQEHWNYNYSQQLVWLKQNLLPDDVHLMAYIYNENSENKQKYLVAYMNIVQITVTIDDQIFYMLGIGNVCVAKRFEHQGCGRQLIEMANSYLDKNRSIGVLLCKSSLVDFYKKIGWVTFENVEIYINSKGYQNNIMYYLSNNIEDKIRKCNVIRINRNF